MLRAAFDSLFQHLFSAILLLSTILMQCSFFFIFLSHLRVIEFLINEIFCRKKLALSGLHMPCIHQLLILIFMALRRKRRIEYCFQIQIHTCLDCWEEKKGLNPHENLFYHGVCFFYQVHRGILLLITPWFHVVGPACLSVTYTWYNYPPFNHVPKLSRFHFEYTKMKKLKHFNFVIYSIIPP